MKEISVVDYKIFGAAQSKQSSVLSTFSLHTLCSWQHFEIANRNNNVVLSFLE